ncbi:hypothetical protein PZ938_03440 [Luteipulveratus sp. YIM 133132]|uniref:Antitoxin n=1 Tax=Luteipulveratus flavus TaxID=3031728 RepID=A0ABT6C245_9MICO|nr:MULTISPECIES: hypothetical protein [unclassified Luteipulveratus]MDE9364648.1 hypothetical protein [Luteipulveratus sp. YIM 133132]MDF8262808.1 hypothetical protein [Luteipulveratus sp. YIM 133296]
MSSTAAEGAGPVIVRVRPEAVRMARALVRSARRDGETVDPIVAKIADAEQPDQSTDH